jgi:hypothetical protein
MRTTILVPLAIIFCTLCLSRSSLGKGRPIDTNSSKLTVHVSKAGMLSAFGDNHEVEAPISEGFVDEAGRQVRLVIRSPLMRVLDPNLSADKRRQVQERMLGPDVLDVTSFPQITFESVSVEPSGPGRLLVRGQLSLHGVARQVIVNVRIESGHYLGNSTLSQREFGITPVSVGGGAVKVKDELKIEFDVRTAETSTEVISK